MYILLLGLIFSITLITNQLHSANNETSENYEFDSLPNNLVIILCISSQETWMTTNLVAVR